MQFKYLPHNSSLKHLKSQAEKLHKADQHGEAEAFLPETPRRDRCRDFTLYVARPR